MSLVAELVWPKNNNHGPRTSSELKHFEKQILHRSRMHTPTSKPSQVQKKNTVVEIQCWINSLFFFFQIKTMHCEQVFFLEGEIVLCKCEF